MSRNLLFNIKNGLLVFGFFGAGIWPVHAAVVATSSPYATHAAQEILQSGGNAVDAACAAVFALGVSQPYFTGLGGGGFAVLDMGGKSNPVFYDFREQAPASVSGKLFYTTKGKPESSWVTRNTGAWSVGIPGNVAGCGKLVAQHGRLGWKRVLEPAIQLARKGIEVSQLFQEEVAEQWARLDHLDLTRAWFGGVQGGGIKKGEQLVQTQLADTLEKLAEAGADDFYRGKLAGAWLPSAAAHGVKITADDLSRYSVLQTPRTDFEAGDLSGVTAPAPSGSSWMVVGVMRFLSQYYRANPSITADAPLRYVAQIEATAYFSKQRDTFMADPKRAKLSLNDFMGTGRERAAWKTLFARIAERGKKIRKAQAGGKHSKSSTPHKAPAHTAHVSVVDDRGGVVALTSSLGNILGSGVAVSEHGFMLNSTMGDFDAVATGINSPAAGMRPRSNMSPTIFYRSDRSGRRVPVAVVGAAGGPLIPQAVVQYVDNYFHFAMDASSAMTAPRVSTSDGKSIELENTASEELRSALLSAGYQVETVPIIWAVFEGAIRKNPSDAWEGISDTRYDGLAWAGSAVEKAQ